VADSTQALGLKWMAQSGLTVAESQVTNLTADLAVKAPLASPAFTGTPSAPTPATSDNSTTLATTAYVKAQGSGTGGASVKTAGYTAVSGDTGKLLVFNSAGAVTLTLPSTPPSATWTIAVQDIGAGALTVSPNGLQLDGVSASLILVQGSGIVVYTDGTNYFTVRGIPYSGSGSLMNYTGSYSSSSTYAVGSVALYNGKLYLRQVATGGTVNAMLRNTSAQVLTGSSVSVSLPSGSVAGDLCIIFAGCPNGVTTPPAGWTTAASTGAVTFWNGMTVYKVLTSGDVSSGNVTFGLAGSGVNVFSAATFVGNTGGVREVDLANSSSSTASSVTGPTTSSLAATDFALYFGSNRASGLNTVSRGTKQQQVTDSSSAAACLYSEAISAAGAISPTFNYPGTYSPQGNYEAVAVIIGAPSSGTPDIDTGDWIPFSSSGSSIFFGQGEAVAAGGETLITLGSTPLPNSLNIYKNGSLPRPSTFYTLIGATAALAAALSTSDVIVANWATSASSPVGISLSAVSSVYSHSAAITISHLKVPNTDQTNFPVLFYGTYALLATTANGGHVTNSSGYDIIFASDSAGNTPLSFERTSYNPTTGAVEFWIKAPTLSHTTDTVIYILYGASSVTTDQQTRTAAWDSSFEGVWHCGAGGTLSVTDSTSNAIAFTNTSVTASSSGEIGTAASFDGSSTSLASSSSALNSWTAQTISLWAKANTGMNQFARVIEKGANNEWTVIFNVTAASNKLSVQGLGTTTALLTSAATLTGAWHKVDVVITSGNVVSLYVDGVLDSSATSTTSPASKTNALTVGNYGGGGAFHYSGLIDELRISNAVRSADWLATEYNNQSSPSTFYSVTLT
jgi:hypothetical protein